jgi:hypothetical protein
VRPELPAGVGQAHGPGRADEQRYAEVGLEPADPLGKPLLAEEQLAGGAPEVELVRGDDERPHVGDV